MKKLFFTFLFLISFVANAQYTLIPDPEFEYFLIYKGYDSGNIDGKVLTSNISSIKEIYFFPGAANINIKDLTGIEDFTALEKLNCTNCNLTSLDLTKNISLTELICENNKLTSLNVTGCVNLETINCNGNQFTSLDFTKTINLKTLYCRGTKLTVLDLNTNLTYLDCSYNKIITLDLSKSILLETLACLDCNLNSLDISNNINLTSLSCLNNQLTYLDVSKNVKLIQLSCENNLLNNLDITNNHELLFLQCSSNQLTNLNISQNIKLTNLYCSSNQIINLDTSNNTYLSELWCFNNQITSLDISKSINLIKLLCYDNKLISLNTSQNLILEILYCHNNLITSLDVSMNNNLGIFRCSNNQLTYLDLRNEASWTWWNDASYWTNNPKLDCIYVPDAIFFTIFYSNRKDSTANYFDESPPKFESSIQTICYKQNPTIKDIAVTGYNIKWFDSLFGGNELSNTIVLAEGTTYFAMNTAGSCESLRTPITITFQPISAPSGTSPQNLCNIKNPTLDNLSLSGTLIKWYDAANGGNLLVNSTLLTNSSSYYASQTQNGCESPRIPILVNLLNIVQPLAAFPQTFCIQQNATLNNITITGQNIKWYDSLTSGTLLLNTTRLQNGTNYYASQTINGCESDRIPVLINIQNTPTPTGDTNQSFCSTQNATLNNIEITGTNIKWYDNSNTELPNTTLISDNATYCATQTSNGCESVNKIVVNTFLINTLNATNYTVEFCDDANDGKEILDLSAYNPNLIANPTGNSFSYYNYRTAAENQIINDRINTINNYVLSTGSRTLFVRIDSQNSCHQIVELNLKLYSKPKILINDIMPICEGSSITINAGAGYDNYLWSTGETSSTITIQNPGNYSVTVANNYSTISCSSTKNFEVRKSNIANITSIDTQDWTDNQNTITVYVTGSGDFEYSTDGIHFQDSNQFSNLISSQYTVHVRDKNGCGTVTDEVYLLMYPKFFTPNGDGFNDTWKIKFSDVEEDLTVKIFDRYGKLIVELKNNSAWNGTFNGQELPATDYWFVVTRSNGKEYRGHFSLKR
jgi:gliding motility-associated-like protein